jgi:hypothetical protein
MEFVALLMMLYCSVGNAECENPIVSVVFLVGKLIFDKPMETSN